MQFKRPSGPPNMFTLVCATTVGTVCITLILPSVPAIAIHYGTSDTVAQFTIAAYLFTSAILQLIVGPLSDRYGRRPVMLTTFVLFLLGSLICVVAPTIEILIAGRIIQAVAVSGLVLARAIIRDVYGAGKSASKIGYLTMGMAVGPLIAPVLGGFVEQHFGWQANFWVMFMLAISVLVLLFFTLGETNTSEFSSFKNQIRQYPQLLRARRFWGLSLTAAFNSGAYFAFLGGGAFFAFSVLDLSPSAFGFFYAFLTTGYITGNFISGRLAGRVGTHAMALAGTLITVCGAATPMLFLWLGLVEPFFMFGPLFLLTLGNGLTLPSVTAAMIGVRPKLAGTASGLGGSIQVGGASAISVLSVTLVTEVPIDYMLFLVMTGSSLLSVAATLYVIFRARKVAAMGGPQAEEAAEEGAPVENPVHPRF